MTEDQFALLQDKISVWRTTTNVGPVEFRDYNRRAADALTAALVERADLERALQSAAPFFALAKAVTDTSDPGYRDWFAEAGDHCVAFSFAGSSITLGDLRKATKASPPERDHEERRTDGPEASGMTSHPRHQGGA